MHTDVPGTLWEAVGGCPHGNNLITSHCKYKNRTTREQTHTTQQTWPRVPAEGL